MSDMFSSEGESTRIDLSIRCRVLMDALKGTAGLYTVIKLGLCTTAVILKQSSGKRTNTLGLGRIMTGRVITKTKMEWVLGLTIKNSLRE